MSTEIKIKEAKELRDCLEYLIKNVRNMIFEVVICKAIDKSMRFNRQVYFVETNLDNSFHLKEDLLSTINANKDRFSDECIYDSEMEKKGLCNVTIVSFIVKPKWIPENEFLVDNIK